MKMNGPKGVVVPFHGFNYDCSTSEDGCALQSNNAQGLGNRVWILDVWERNVSTFSIFLFNSLVLAVFVCGTWTAQLTPPSTDT